MAKVAPAKEGRARGASCALGRGAAQRKVLGEVVWAARGGAAPSSEGSHAPAQARDGGAVDSSRERAPRQWKRVARQSRGRFGM